MLLNALGRGSPKSKCHPEVQSKPIFVGWVLCVGGWSEVWGCVAECFGKMVTKIKISPLGAIQANICWVVFVWGGIFWGVLLNDLGRWAFHGQFFIL